MISSIIRIFFPRLGINNSNIFSIFLNLIKIDLFDEFSSQWIREKCKNPFGAVAAKRDLMEVSNEQTFGLKCISKKLFIYVGKMFLCTTHCNQRYGKRPVVLKPNF